MMMGTLMMDRSATSGVCSRCAIHQASTARGGRASTSSPAWHSGSAHRWQSRQRHVPQAAAAPAAPPALEGFDVTKMQPLGDRLLVKPLEEANTTAGGLIMSTGATKHIHDASIGKVLGIGEDVESEVKVGDTVVFSKYSTSDIKVSDGEVCFVAVKSILATLS